MRTTPISLAALAALVLCVAARAQEPGSPTVAAALTDEQVQITSRFTGARIDVFGVVNGLLPSDDIVVIVRGPTEPVRIARKERRVGVWITGEPRLFEDVPGYHAVASTRALDEIEGSGVITRGELNLRPAPAETGLSANQIRAYRDGLVRIRTNDEVYRNVPGGVDRYPGGLFRARVLLPPGSPTGVYRVEVYVFREGRVTSARASQLEVVKVGIERFITNAAHERPMIYGIACVLLAGFSGWLAGAAFGRR